MKNYKSFLIKLCEIENVTVKELMEITGKSQSVVYSWLNYSKPNFPTIESLGKILFRLGMSLDDFINYRHPIYDDGNAARVYYRYVYGAFDQSYIGSELLDLPNAEDVIKTYLADRLLLNRMITDHVNGLEIDIDKFDFLCKALMPVLVSDIITDAEQSVYSLNSYTINDYKPGIEQIKESKEEYDGEQDFDIPEHYIYFPNADEVILLAADNNPSFINEYLAIIDEREKVFLIDSYMRIREDNPNYDKKNKIIQRLFENDCVCYESKDKDINNQYYELLKKIIGI